MSAGGVSDGWDSGLDPWFHSPVLWHLRRSSRLGGEGLQRSHPATSAPSASWTVPARSHGVVPEPYTTHRHTTYTVLVDHIRSYLYYGVSVSIDQGLSIGPFSGFGSSWIHLWGVVCRSYELVRSAAW